VRILHDSAVSRTGAQTSRVGAVHALILPHQPSETPVLKLVLVKPDQVVVIPSQIRHGLVAVVERRLMEGIAVPFDARDLAGFASNAGSNVDQLADPARLFAL